MLALVNPESNGFGADAVILVYHAGEKKVYSINAEGTAPRLDETLLAQFPEGYRHLAYAQTRIGYTVKRDMPGLKGPGVQALYAKGRAWLAGGAISPRPSTDPSILSPATTAPTPSGVPV